MLKPKVVLLIFVSGKIVLTGAKVMPFRVLVLYQTIDPRGHSDPRGDLHRIQYDLSRAS